MPVLHWINDGDARCAAALVPFHLLERKVVYGDPDQAEKNLIVHGDNLVALKALLPFYKGKVKCIYIDPPYNTGSAFEHYDDNLEHSQWLSTMVPRLQLLREFICKDGSIWVSIDKEESHYLKVIMDEIFGRKNFVTEIAWQQRTARENRKVFSSNFETIFVYARNYDSFCMVRNPLPLTEEIRARYKNPDNDPRGVWQSVALTVQAGHGTPSQFYTITTPTGRKVNPPAGLCWRYTKERFEELVADKQIYFGATGNNVPRIKKFFSEMPKGVTPETLWLAGEAGTNDLAKKHSVALFGKNPFDNPKPESLIHRVLSIATNPGDLVLDAFLGSGTTAAVAHKMGRHYIGIEMGTHALTHCIPRLEKVIEGEQGGISETVNWQGGGGFRFYELGAPVFDKYGAINPQVTFETLAAYVWQSETGCVGNPEKKPFLGVKDGVGIYLLYNGVLGDKRPESGNILTPELLNDLLVRYPHEGSKVIFAEAMIGIDDLELREMQITFKQIPYDIRD